MNIKTKILLPSLVAALMMLLLGVVSHAGMARMQRCLLYTSRCV